MPGRFRTLLILLALSALLTLPTVPANAQETKYVCVVLDHDTGILYECDLSTGAARRPRPTGIRGSVGIAFYGATDSLFALTDHHATPVPDALYSINPYTGHSTLIGRAGLPVLGGDLLYDPLAKVLYAVQNGATSHSNKLLRIDPKTGAARVLFTIPSPKKGFRSLSSLTLNKNSTLVYATDAQQETLLAIDPTCGRILTEKPLSDYIGADCGLRLNRYGDNRYYLADGGVGGTKSLYAIDVETAVLTKVGSMNEPGTVDGLTFIPKIPHLR